MKAIEIVKNIYWVGALDFQLRNFHGYRTGRGSTYNAYLIIDEKVTLIDTVKAPFAEEMLERIASVLPPSSIDQMIINHVEMDHSGSFPAIRRLCPNAQVFTSGSFGVNGLSAHYGSDNYISVKSGDTISLGVRSLTFLSTPMLHWPDNMITYCPEEQLLFSNDAFGQHLATTERFDTETELSVAMAEAKKYYANILMCYGTQVRTALDAVAKLPIKLIAPSHGILWRNHISDILKAYNRFSLNEPDRYAVVVYDSMWESTARMAVTITESFYQNGVPTVCYDLKYNHYSEIIPAVLTSRYLAVGSPTLNSQLLPSVAGFLSYLKGLTPGNREAFAFGSYGWGGQSITLIEQELEACRFHLCLRGIKIQYVPKKEQLAEITSLISEMLRSVK